MRLIFLLSGLMLIIACGSYKQLKPKPELIPRENDYTPIRDNDKSFELKKGKKYYLEVPGISGGDKYWVVKSDALAVMSSYLTRRFTKGKGDIRIPDAGSELNNQNAYEMDGTVPTYFWVVNQVEQDVNFVADYRYVPVWRYKFETRSAEFQRILARNSVDRQKIEAIGVTLGAADIDFQRDQASLRSKTDNLKAIQGELQETEAIFPAGVKNSGDPAYRAYKTLQDDLSAELKTHENYHDLLTVLQQSASTRYDNPAFVEAIPTFLRFFRKKDQYPASVVKEVQRAIGDRLPAVAPYFESELRRKSDTSPITLPVKEAIDLFVSTGQRPTAEFNALANFVTRYNQNSEALSAARQKLGELKQTIRSGGTWPSDGFYTGIQTQARSLQTNMPGTSLSAYGRFASLECVSELNRQARTLNSDIAVFQQELSSAASLVPEINRYRDRGDYRAIIRLLKDYQGIDFLIAQYPDIDQRSLDRQAEEISRALNNQQWGVAEQRLRTLHEDQEFLDYSTFAVRKREVVVEYEDRLVSAIEQASRQRLEAFLQANNDIINNVDALYASEAFQPVYQLTFASGGSRVLSEQNSRVQNFLNSYKHDKFPATAIENIYKDFVSDIRNNGVSKARAVAAHGRYYRGNDRKIKNLIAECTPGIAKWITQPKSYRKIYVLPTNAGQQAQNEYVFRMNIRIDSDAKFPVYDVNIKLPREVAGAAATSQWYERITINDQLIKNEGRFTITAPTGQNDYECQITPVQMNKDQDNILEVRFKHSAFKVLEVSVMCQRPIMKRN